ncbi:hypothetical protein ACIBJC_06480 [Streptomyces sp. NPDC050509]|uniref:hypothetical protein n=1 Tax=Streptomyces sp. NPDC050509 TaxID=3365620 RepID=UPI0037994BAC
MAWYLERVMERVGEDPVVGDAFRGVTHLNSTVGVLFAPRVVRAVLFGQVAPVLSDPGRREPGRHASRPVAG